MQKHGKSGRALMALLGVCGMAIAGGNASAQTWTKVAINPPEEIELMLLLPDGSIMAGHTYGSATGYGKTWYKLTPNAAGSYVNGTWTALASSIDTRLWYSSQVLKDGRVFVAGGEYGSGNAKAEVYNPTTNTWTAAPIPTTLLNPAQTSPVTGLSQQFYDSNSEILPSGNVLITPVCPKTANQSLIYNPTTNTWSAGPNMLNASYQDEATWVKLPDNTILTNDPFALKSERYNPATNSWINDATLTAQLYDSFGFEQGGGALLPNGKVLFLGGTGNTCLYTPTGTTSPGTWATGPVMPGGRGMPDAPCANLINGKVLAAMSPAPTSANHFPTPVSFFEYDPTTNAWSQVNAPNGTTTDNISSYQALMLNLPSGQIAYSHFKSEVWIYTPAGSAIAAGKPTIQSITKNLDGSFHLTGLKINGISEGASYGDDAQMNTNYPIVRINHSNGNVYYARTHDWSSTGVTAGTAVGTSATTEYNLPSMPAGSYTLVVVANGIASDPAVGPSITGQPNSSQTVTAGDPVSIGVAAAGTANLNYQWRIGTTNLVNSGAISGATSSTLVINPVASGNAAANYNCVITNALGSVTTWDCEIKVRCNMADVNADGQLDLVDFFQFLGDFDQTLPGADVDGNGDVDLGDFFGFLGAFDAGC